MLFTKRLADGTIERRRPAYQAKNYTVTAKQLDLARAVATTQSYDDALNGREGMLEGWKELERVTHDGKTWAILQAISSEVLIELEIKPDGSAGEANALPPERAWALVLEQDKRRGGVIHDF